MSRPGRRLVTNDVHTPPPPGPIAEMDEDEYRRFVNMMLWLVIDEAEPIAEFGERSVEHVGGDEIVWGPWPRADCSRLLTRWLEAGLLAVFDLEGEIERSRARAILATPDGWRSARGLSTPYVAATETGAEVADDEWLRVVEDLRREGPDQRA